MIKARILVPVMLCVIMGFGQDNPIKIVFDVTSADVKVHESALRHVKAMSKNYPNSDFEVVIYSGALNMVLKEKSTIAKEIESFADNPRVNFVVCQGTMRRFKVDQTQILKGVDSVPDGILEIVDKQSKGWGYIKEAN
ncbi:MAG: DsrE family protein [Schleiferiaceae bacterium]|jgi:intracellular sulfur oxidation DsrE/DsrF family protein|nr:DsrE family protein [Schleiferiaceae bacterium]